MYRVGCYMLGAGMDMPSVAHTIYAMKPLDVQHARKLLALAIAALKYANTTTPSGLFVPDQSGAIARRSKYVDQLQNIDNSLATAAAHLDTDIIPESAAAVLREAVVNAITEYNSVAEGNETLSGARTKLYNDIADNAADLARKGYALAKGAVQAAEDAGKKVLWYTQATYWVLIGLGVGVTGLLAFGMYKGLSSGKLRVR